MICTMRCCRWILSFNTKKGEELKVPYYTSAAVTRDSNLPHVTATCYTQRQFASYCNAIYSSYTRSTLENIKDQYPTTMQFENPYIRFSFFSSFLPSFLPYAFISVLLSVARSTHSTIFNSIGFILISRLRANNSLLLVIASIGLLSPLIYLTSAISRLLYN